ncbi:helix-turn-helix domain-containing protein [Franconibacter pulveris]
MKTISEIRKLHNKVAPVFTAAPAVLAERSPAVRTLSFNDLHRPAKAIDELMACFLPASTPCKPKTGMLTARPGEDEGFIYLIRSGRFDTFRLIDDLYLGVGYGPAIVGLQEVFCHAPSRHYVQVMADTSVHALPARRARELIEQHNLWQSASLILSFYLMFMMYRDEHMVSKSAYTVVRAKLMEYMENRDFHMMRKESIGPFIQKTTTLSRSLIYKILAELTEGGYITVNRGCLVKIFYLPEAL